MKELIKQGIRSKTMNGNNQSVKVSKQTQRAPLFASPWMALYMVLRNELIQSRS